MGGKGGGGGDYYAMPPDTSGYGTPEEALATLKATKPVDLTGYQQSINASKAAHDATAPDISGAFTPPDQPLNHPLVDSVLKPPGFWQNKSSPKRSSIQTTQT